MLLNRGTSPCRDTRLSPGCLEPSPPVRTARYLPGGRAPHALLLAALAALGVPCATGQSPLADKLKEANIRVRTEHYALAGTVTPARLQEYGRLLEYIHREYSAGFAEVLADPNSADPNSAAPAPESPARPPAKPARTPRDRSTGAARGQTPRRAPATPTEPAPEQTLDQEQQLFRVLVFAGRNQYVEFGREYVGGGTEHTSGVFIAQPPVLLIHDQGNINDTCDVLFHEAFHQFMQRHVKDPPMWLNEGLACYYGDAQPGGRGLRFDRLNADAWKLARKLIDKKKFIPLAEVVHATRAEFYDGTPLSLSGYDDLTRRNAFYVEAYTLIHAMLADQTARPRLQQYLRDLARDDGRSTAKITAQYFDRETCDRITPHWIRHVQSRPENK